MAIFPANTFVVILKLRNLWKRGGKMLSASLPTPSAVGHKQTLNVHENHSGKRELNVP